MGLNDRILIISDRQAPHHHRKFHGWLKYLKKDIKPTRIIDIGDSEDFTSLNNYGLDPNLDSCAKEWEKTKDAHKETASIFPKMDILYSNHLQRFFKRAEEAGLSSQFLKPMHEIYDLPKGWVYHRKLIVTNVPKVGNILFQHGHQGPAIKYSQSHGISVVSGHYHSKCYIQYWKDSLSKLKFAMQVGSMINNQSRAFNYNKEDELYPIISFATIIKGKPDLIVME